MIMGDDDIPDSRLMKYYEHFIANNYHYFGVKDVFFYNAPTGHSMKFEYQYKYDKLIGCGRMISRFALERSCAFVGVAPHNKLKIGEVFFEVGFEKFINKHLADYLLDLNAIVISSDVEYNLFGKDLNSGLDFHSESLLVMNGFYPKAIVSERPLITDVKTEQNIWSFSDHVSKCKLQPKYSALCFFSNDELEYLRTNFTN
jgi:hypothetical protein